MLWYCQRTKNDPQVGINQAHRFERLHPGPTNQILQAAPHQYMHYSPQFASAGFCPWLPSSVPEEVIITLSEFLKLMYKYINTNQSTCINIYSFKHIITMPRIKWIDLIHKRITTNIILLLKEQS